MFPIVRRWRAFPLSIHKFTCRQSSSSTLWKVILLKEEPRPSGAHPPSSAESPIRFTTGTEINLSPTMCKDLSILEKFMIKDMTNTNLLDKLLLGTLNELHGKKKSYERNKLIHGADILAHFGYWKRRIHEGDAGGAAHAESAGKAVYGIKFSEYHASLPEAPEIVINSFNDRTNLRRLRKRRKIRSGPETHQIRKDLNDVVKDWTKSIKSFDYGKNKQKYDRARSAMIQLEEQLHTTKPKKGDTKESTGKGGEIAGAGEM